MTSKRSALVLAVSVGIFLFTSQFLAAAQVDEASAKPDALNRYVAATIGDARILNPILNADAASSSICEMIFEGLIDRDRDLNWRGRLAKSWEISEEAYFIVNPKDKRTPEQIAALVRAEMARPVGEITPLSMCMANITDVKVESARTIRRDVTEILSNEPGRRHRVNVGLTIRRPPRIRLTLKTIDVNVFESLETILGAKYFSSFDPPKLIDVSPAGFAKHKAKYAAQFLKTTEHNPVIVFHLRKGVKFHDGHEFDSGDVKFTYESIIDRKNRSVRISDYEPVKAVGTPNKHTVRVVYKRLFSPGFGSWAIGILPEHLLGKERLRAEAKERGIPPEEFVMGRSDFHLRPVGCGPFKFAEWERKKHIKLKRFGDYWEGAPEFEEYVMRVIPNSEDQKREFLAGRIDSYNLKPKEADKLAKDGRFQRFSGLSYGYSYIGYNMRREPFNDKRVRRALGMAIDVGALIKNIALGQGERITGPFIKQTDYYDHSIKPLPYDPKASVRLLQEAGWIRNDAGWLEKNGKRLRFKLITNTGNDIRKGIADAAGRYWRAIGVDATTECLEWGTFIKHHIDKASFDACMLGWSMGIEPDLCQIWHTSQTTPGLLNFCGFENEQADDLIIRIRETYDKKKQVKLCHSLHRIIADEQPYTFLYASKWTALLSKQLVVVRRDKAGKIIGYEKIKPTKTGSYAFDFNRWTKVLNLPKSLR